MINITKSMIDNAWHQVQLSASKGTTDRYALFCIAVVELGGSQYQMMRTTAERLVDVFLAGSSLDSLRIENYIVEYFAKEDPYKSYMPNWLNGRIAVQILVDDSGNGYKYAGEAASTALNQFSEVRIISVRLQ